MFLSFLLHSRATRLWLLTILWLTCIKTPQGLILNITLSKNAYGSSFVLAIAEINIFYNDGTGTIVPMFGSAAITSSSGGSLYGYSGITPTSYTDSTTGAGSTAVIPYRDTTTLGTAGATITTTSSMTAANDAVDGVSIGYSASTHNARVGFPSLSPPSPSPSPSIRPHLIRLAF